MGIVLGSVGGFLLLLWLFYTCFNVGRPSEDDSVVEEVVVRDKRKRHSKGKVFSSAQDTSRRITDSLRIASTRSRRVSETVEVRRGQSPIRVVRPTVVVTPGATRTERIIVEEQRRQVRRDDLGGGGSDEIVVIEDHPRRKKKKRQSGGY